MEWTSADSVNLRKYDQATGAKLRAYLRTRVPQLKGDTIEAVALSSKEKAGAEYMLSVIDSLLADTKLPTDGSGTGFTTM
jgi:hypothetical protein